MKWMGLFGVALLALPSLAFADASQGFGSVFNMFFGTQSDETSTASCNEPTDGNQGLLGTVNMVFCHLENDMGIKTIGKATKQFTQNGQTIAVKCDVEAATSGSYANTASCWVCAASGCSTSSADSSFVALMNLSWTYTKGSVNKGQLLMDNGAFQGTSGQTGMDITWDLSSSPASPCTGGNQCVTGKAIFSGSNGSGGTASFPMALAAQKNASTNVRSAQMVMGASIMQMVLNMSENTSSNDVLVNFEQASVPSCSNGMDAIQSGTTADSSCTQCFTRTASSTDFTYATASASTCTSLSLSALPDSAANVGSYTFATVMTPSGGSEWNGMAANPTF